MSGDSDADLLRAYAEREDEGAFRRLVERRLGLVHGVARRRLRDPALAEEISQNVFAALARVARQGQTIERSVTAWLYQTTLKQTAHALRQERLHAAKMKTYATEQWTKAEAAPAASIHDLDEALAGLQTLDREILLLYYVEGRSFEEIGRVVGKSEAACQKRHTRALAKLEKRLRGSAIGMAGLGAGILQLATEPTEASAAGVASRALQLAKITAVAAAGGFVALLKLAAIGLGIIAVAAPLAGLKTTPTAYAQEVPVVVGAWPGYQRVNPQRIIQRGNIAYVTGWPFIQAIDLADPIQPRVIGTWPVYPPSGRGIFIANQHLFVGNFGLDIFDLSDPRQPLFHSHLDLRRDRQGVSDVAVEDDLLVVVDTFLGMSILDISEPDDPKELLDWNLEFKAHAVRVVGKTAYLAEHSLSRLITSEEWDGLSQQEKADILNYNNFLIVDISDPKRPRKLGGVHYNTANRHSIDRIDMAIQGSHAYITDSADLQIIDISNPMVPTVASFLSVPGGTRGMDVHANHAFVVARESGLHVIDISRPSLPRVIGKISIFGEANDVVTLGRYVCVTANSGGTQIIDISDPANPRLASEVSNGGYVSAVDVSGNHAFVADQVLGLLSFDLRDASRPRQWPERTNLAG